MMALLVAYDQSDPPHVHRWTVDVVDVETAARVVGQLWRQHRRTGCPQCPATRFTVSTPRGRHGLWAIAVSGALSDVSRMPGCADCDPLAGPDHPRIG